MMILTVVDSKTIQLVKVNQHDNAQCMVMMIHEWRTHTRQ